MADVADCCGICCMCAACFALCGRGCFWLPFCKKKYVDDDDEEFANQVERDGRREVVELYAQAQPTRQMQMAPGAASEGVQNQTERREGHVEQGGVGGQNGLTKNGGDIEDAVKDRTSDSERQNNGARTRSEHVDAIRQLRQDRRDVMPMRPSRAHAPYPSQ